MQFSRQPCVPPAGEERVDPRPGRKVGRHRPPLDAVVDEVAHRVDHLPVAVALRPAAAARQPSRNRQQIPHHSPLGITHVRAVAGPSIWLVDGVPEPVREAVTPASGGTGPGNHDHATLRQRGLLLLAGLDNRELPRALLPRPRTGQLARTSTLFEPSPTLQADREQAVRGCPVWGVSYPVRAGLWSRAMPGMAWWAPSPLSRQSRRTFPFFSATGHVPSGLAPGGGRRSPPLGVV